LPASPEFPWRQCSCCGRRGSLAIQEKLDGKAVEWMEQVADEQYHGTG
jgi:hypothetical protein